MAVLQDKRGRFGGCPTFAILAVVVVAVSPIYGPSSADKLDTIVYEHAPDEHAPWPMLDIYSLDTDNKNPRPLTKDGHSHTPSWSGDGQHILFIHDGKLHTKPPYHLTAETESHHPVELYIMNRDGSSPHLVRRFETPILQASLSPDGKMVAATAAFLPGRSAGPGAMPEDPTKQPIPGLFLFPLDGQSEPHLLFRDAFTPAWSPDGNRVAFSVHLPGSRWAVHVSQVDGSGEVQLTDPSLNASSPSWSPDGRHIAYEASTEGHGLREIFTMDADGSRQCQLTTDYNWECSAPSWSHRGEKIAFYCRSASAPCGAGVGGHSGKPSGCVRRVFITSAFDPRQKPVQLTDQDAAFPVFAPK